MADQLQIRGGDTASNSTFTGAQRELSVDTSKNQLIVHDGATPGGHPIPNSNNPVFTGDAELGGDLTVGGSASFTGDVTANTVKIQGTGAQAKLDTEVSDLVFSTLNSQGSLSEGFRLTGGTNPGAGSATFNGAITVGPNSTPAGNGLKLNPSGSFISRRDGSGDGVFTVYNGGTATSNVTIGMTNDGSASFAGNVLLDDINSGDALRINMNTSHSGTGVLLTGVSGRYIEALSDDGDGTFIWDANSLRYGGVLGSSPNLQLNSDGSATFKGRLDVAPNGITTTTDYVSLYEQGAVGVRRNSGNDSDYLWTGISGTTETSRINKDGSAEFAGGKDKFFADGAFNFYRQSSVVTANLGAFFSDVGGTKTEVVTFKNDGSATFSGTVTATVVPPSDARFKENIAPAKPQLADVVALGGLLKNYDWNEDAPVNEELRSQRQLGLIAQEAEEICPTITKDIARTKQGAMLTPEKVIPAVTKQVVNEEGVATTVIVTPEEIIPATYEELDDSYRGISTDALIMKMLGAITELTARVEELEKV